MQGKLKDVIEDTTPKGQLSTRHSTPEETSSTSPAVICGNEQANSVTSIALATSARPSEIVFPFSRCTSSANSSVCRSSNPR